MQQACFLLRLVAQRIDSQLGTARIQDTDHDLLAEQCRQGTDAEIDYPIGADLELHAAILGNALFRDVQA